MKKPVAEVNIKIFKKDRKYCGGTKIGMNSDDPELVLAILKALDDISARFAKDSAKKLAKASERCFEKYFRRRGSRGAF